MQIAMLAADFTRRRGRPAAPRDGGVEAARRPRRRSTSGWSAAWSRRATTREYAERIFKQIEGFGEYGFPESHAASFALLAYVSSWIKCHHPDAFLAGLLNSQPMGFYAPAQLVRDAREHGVEVRPVDVTVSGWDSTLEARAGAAGCRAPATRRRGRAAARRCASASTASRASPRRPAERIVAARARGAASRASKTWRGAPRSTPTRCSARATADALRALTGHRHQAAWAVAGIDTRPTADAARDAHRTRRRSRSPRRAKAEDDRSPTTASLGLTLKPPSARAAARSSSRAFRVAAGGARCARYPNGRLARASGLVTHRQRPETAKGTVFVTLEDETGAVNVIVWPKVAEAQRKPLLGATLLTVYGQWQRQGEGEQAVMHLRRREDDRPLAAAARAWSAAAAISARRSRGRRDAGCACPAVASGKIVA